MKDLLNISGTQSVIIDMSSYKDYRSCWIFSNKKLEELRHIKKLKKLEKLKCLHNKLISLDISGLTNLELLDCTHNQIQNLQLSNNKSLEVLECSFNKLEFLNLSGAENLKKLRCSTNKFKTLDLSGLKKLTHLYAMNNKFLTELIVPSNLYVLQLSYCDNLKSVTIGENKIDVFISGNNVFTKTSDGRMEIIAKFIKENSR